ncbi:hypothetical protein [Thermocatellispora tengchongensis]|uniref:hypothetical protein n=1 Tax=Thermocatellispora tengchongensis TaxID=1073253 RepID=UPI003625BEE8
MDLDEVAGRLYGLAPGDFTAERDAAARAAKEAGDAALAREIRTLRRPTVAAWAVNQASRRHPDELTELLELGAELRRVWQEQDVEALAELTRRRGAASGRLLRLIRETAEAAGQALSGSAPAEIEQTLDAATVDEDAAEQVRRGRLVRPLSYAGFTPAPAAPAGPRPKRPAQPRKKADDRQAREAAEREAREAAERAAREAERAAQEAERDHAEWRAELEAAVAEHDRLTEKVERLSGKLAKARQQLATAAHRREVAEREERRAARTAATARAKTR